MPLKTMDADGNTVYIDATGAGTLEDPFVFQQAVDVSTVPSTVTTPLSTITGHIDTIESLLTTLGGYVDTVETLITALNALVTDIGAGIPTTRTASNNFRAAILEAIPAGTNNIGDVDILSLPAIPAGTNSIGGTKDNGPHWTSSFGVSGARFTSANQSGSAASVTDAPTSGQKLVITDVVVSVDTAMRVDFKEETSGTVLASIYLPANGSFTIVPRSKWKLATADKRLQVQTSASGNIAVLTHYFSEV